MADQAHTLHSMAMTNCSSSFSAKEGSIIVSIVQLDFLTKNLTATISYFCIVYDATKVKGHLCEFVRHSIERDLLTVVRGRCSWLLSTLGGPAHDHGRNSSHDPGVGGEEERERRESKVLKVQKRTKLPPGTELTRTPNMVPISSYMHSMAISSSSGAKT